MFIGEGAMPMKSFPSLAGCSLGKEHWSDKTKVKEDPPKGLVPPTYRQNTISIFPFIVDTFYTIISCASCVLQFPPQGLVSAFAVASSFILVSDERGSQNFHFRLETYTLLSI
ncbi:hypothetical protein VNO78_03200 [Psophocarpus tetragonolobus]|uniref:Uncharacterized protein n=1 Tax=Psophocarpus tetragonolobus TaxID=3891 RepID=A0AAN9T014_PSOTE